MLGTKLPPITNSSSRIDSSSEPVSDVASHEEVDGRRMSLTIHIDSIPKSVESSSAEPPSKLTASSWDPSLAGLPSALINQLATHLTASEIAALRQACRRFNHELSMGAVGTFLTSNNERWHALVSHRVTAAKVERLQLRHAAHAYDGPLPWDGAHLIIASGILASTAALAGAIAMLEFGEHDEATTIVAGMFGAFGTVGLVCAGCCLVNFCRNLPDLRHRTAFQELAQARHELAGLWTTLQEAHTNVDDAERAFRSPPKAATESTLVFVPLQVEDPA